LITCVLNLYLYTFQDQASIYDSKVDAVKAEHAKLLEEAFERAKVGFVQNQLLVFSNVQIPDRVKLPKHMVKNSKLFDLILMWPLIKFKKRTELL